MLRSRILPATMAAAILFGAAGAVSAESGEHENARELATVLGAKTSLTQAIAAAERRTGGQAMKADIEKEKGAYLYEIKTASKDKVAEVFVDPASGQVVRTDEEGSIAKAFGRIAEIFDRDDRARFDKLAAAPTTLAAAVATAEHHTGGRAIEARLEKEGGSMLFEVNVAKDNAVHKVMISPTSGKVVKVAAGEHDED